MDESLGSLNPSRGVRCRVLSLSHLSPDPSPFFHLSLSFLAFFHSPCLTRLTLILTTLVLAGGSRTIHPRIHDASSRPLPAEIDGLDHFSRLALCGVLMPATRNPSPWHFLHMWLLFTRAQLHKLQPICKSDPAKPGRSSSERLHARIRRLADNWLSPSQARSVA